MRITGGTLRSRAIRAPRGTATRPTSDRVREALFSILASSSAVEGARVLDLYAGTGALAFEALSRGASEAILVESSKEALAAVRANVADLDLAGRVRVIAASVDRALARIEGPFDIVFLDPPYAQAAVAGARAIAALVTRSLLARGARVVLEHARADAPPEIESLELESTRRYGDTALSFYRLV
jgi:16S rRNA (guanine(966)-N(2))-methyltransferase RsmD